MDKKKLFIKRNWWVLLITFIVLIGVVGYSLYSSQAQKKKDEEKERQKQEQIKINQTKENQGYQYVDPLMTAAQLEKAHSVLAMGVAIDDPENDFAVSPVGPVGLDGKTDNPDGYQLDWNDIKKVSFGADQENFYVRYDFYGTIPNTMVTVNGDDVKTLSSNIGLSRFTTTNGKTDEGLWQVGIMFAQQRGDDSKDESVGYDAITPRIGLTSIATPTPAQDKYGETMYATSSSDGAVSGGAGSDYIIALFPLANLNVAPGTDITFDITVETNSRTYHHSSIDPLLDFGSEKSGEIITYPLGSNTYTSVKPDYK